MRAPRVLPLIATVAAFLVLLFGRGYPWQLALLAATAIGALAYAILRTVQNMRVLSAGARFSRDDRESRPAPPPAADAPNRGEPSR